MPTSIVTSPLSLPRGGGVTTKTKTTTTTTKGALVKEPTAKAAREIQAAARAAQTAQQQRRPSSNMTEAATCVSAKSQRDPTREETLAPPASAPPIPLTTTVVCSKTSSASFSSTLLSSSSPPSPPSPPSLLPPTSNSQTSPNNHSNSSHNNLNDRLLSRFVNNTSGGSSTTSPSPRSTRSLSGNETDDDEEPPEASMTDSLAWRRDPRESLSDWTMEVVVTGSDLKKDNDDDDEEEDDEEENDNDDDNDAHVASAHPSSKSQKQQQQQQQQQPRVSKPTTSTTTTYHVHKHVLAAGPQKSEYFARLFRSSAGERSPADKNTHNNSCRIELHAIAARAIPLVLDFLYAPYLRVQVTTENATALHWLGQYLGIRRLRWEAKQFWKQDLTTETCGTYYEHAFWLRDDQVLSYVTRFIQENIEAIDTSSRVVHVPDPTFWVTVCEHSAMTKYLSIHLSQLINAFCCQNEVDAPTFAKLTQEKYLPVIHGHVALSFLDLERTIMAPHPATLSSLQTRCLDALARVWKTVQITDEKHMEIIHKLSPLVISTIFAQSIHCARADNQRLEQESLEQSEALQRLETLTAEQKLEMDRLEKLTTEQAETVQTATKAKERLEKQLKEETERYEYIIKAQTQELEAARLEIPRLEKVVKDQLILLKTASHDADKFRKLHEDEYWTRVNAEKDKEKLDKLSKEQAKELARFHRATKGAGCTIEHNKPVADCNMPRIRKYPNEQGMNMKVCGKVLPAFYYDPGEWPV